MHYVYMLRNEETKELYYGYTNNLKRRFTEHNQKQKCELIYYEAYKAELDARDRERRLKQYAPSINCIKGTFKRIIEITLLGVGFNSHIQLMSLFELHKLCAH